MSNQDTMNKEPFETVADLRITDELLRECARVRAIKAVYEAREDGTGALGARLMERELRAADAAMASGYTIAMLRIYENLKKWGK